MTDSPNLLAWETCLGKAGYQTVVGLDEVGRGALAGPIIAAAVVLPPDVDLTSGMWSDICDSKVISSARRETLAAWIAERAARCAVAALEAPVIDEIGIGPANRLVMEMALGKIERMCEVDFLLLDALTIDHAAPQSGIIDGDALSLSIAAASIVAKVHRDAIMTELSATWKAYGWDSNKGYGVARHLQALRQHGPCEHHRFSYRPVRDAGAPSYA
ncbi:MAG TPA: ribonuclease HII [Thermomicrobiales bacterium]|nr:ribonuclease HII [Thermomicrobiales bacterium]